jgi:nitroimidazol reductase NimA-like FMN-containing flavoprotein (pyridoxamine 5'-phosphate oxidase superfamily)
VTARLERRGSEREGVDDVQEMSRAEARDLLGSQTVARVAFCTADGPEIVPVSYTVLDDSIVIRTDPFTRLGTYGRRAVVAVEVDHVDHVGPGGGGRGWSVVLRGRAEHVADPDALARVKADADPEPRVDGSREMYLRVRWDELTGRRFAVDQVSSRQRE